MLLKNLKLNGTYLIKPQIFEDNRVFLKTLIIKKREKREKEVRNLFRAITLSQKNILIGIPFQYKKLI